MSGLAGKRVLLTGASGAVGAATVAALGNRDVKVVGIDREPGPGVLEADLRDVEQTAAAVAEAIERLGGLDVVVNNAGVGDAHDAGAPPDERAVAIVDINLFGAWRVTAAAMPALLSSRGRVVNVASGMAIGNLPFAAAYMASKRGLAAWSDALRLEYRGRISVTTVYPGYIRTPIHDDAAGRGLAMEGMVPPEPLGATVRAIVKACHGRPRRDRASTAMGAVAWSFARHAPGLADRIVAVQARRMLRDGRFAESEIAAGAQAQAMGIPLTTAEPGER